MTPIILPPAGRLARTRPARTRPARTRPTRTRLVAAVVLLLVGSLNGALAQQQPRSDVQPLLDRIDRLERDMRLLHQEWARGGGSAGAARPSSPSSSAGPAADLSGPPVARLEAQVFALEEEFRAINGRNEEIEHKIENVGQRLDKLISDIDMRLSALERGGGAAAAQGQDRPATPEAGREAPLRGATPPGVLGTYSAREGATSGAPAGAGPTPNAQAAKPLSPEEQYNQARRLMIQGKMSEAEQFLKAFLDGYANHELASNAQYWLGETYYQRKDYTAAGQAFAQGYQKYKNGAKAPDSLLKLGMSLAALKKNPEACATFAKLDADYPKAPANIKTVAAEQKKAAGCK